MIRLISSSLKGLSPPPAGHQLIRISHAGGTPKGKARVKDGKALKKSTVRTKKPAAGAGDGAAGASRRGPRGEALERLNSMVDSCLNAPSPIRHLTAKQRRREEEREKLGLISKDRQREIDMEKRRSKGGDSGGGEDLAVIGTPGLDYITLGLVDADKIPAYELTAEDGKRLAKEYSRVLMRRHRARQAAETTLLRLKKEAVAALPESLRAAAMVPDLAISPKNRFMATLTPPIEGYMEKVREAAERYTMKEKLR